MIRELAHFAINVPGVLKLKYTVPQDTLYCTLITRADLAGLADQRDRLVEDLRGHVLEVGAGTGCMFASYRGDTRVTAIEPDPEFAARARDCAASQARQIDVIDGRAEALPLADASVDAAVMCLVLCSVGDAFQACRELARVVRPGGAIRLIEHVRSPNRLAGALMSLVDPLWLAANGQGCHMDRDPLPALAAAGLRVDSVTPFQIWSAGLPAFPMRRIHASCASHASRARGD
jgi:SAM-dependent methyltransferase